MSTRLFALDGGGLGSWRLWKLEKGGELVVVEAAWF